MRLGSKAIKKILTVSVICPGAAIYSFISDQPGKGIAFIIVHIFLCLILSSYWKDILQSRKLTIRLWVYTLLIAGAFSWLAVAPQHNNIFAGVALFVLTPLGIMAAISIAKSKEIEDIGDMK